MEPFRLKLKVGPHEFEAEGEQESVERQFSLWRELIASPSGVIPVAPSPPPAPPGTQPSSAALPELEAKRSDYERLFHHDARVVSLTVLPNGAQRAADAALLVLLGQRTFNQLETVTGQQITDGLKLSGLSVERMDRNWGDHLDVNVLRAGQRRGVKYRLTNPGLVRAREIANELLKTLP
jgi:hypothetical protein